VGVYWQPGAGRRCVEDDGVVAAAPEVCEVVAPRVGIGGIDVVVDDEHAKAALGASRSRHFGGHRARRRLAERQPQGERAALAHALAHGFERPAVQLGQPACEREPDAEATLRAIERAIERLAPYEIAGGAMGLIAGLVIAFLIRSVLFEFISTTGRSGSYVAILLYIILSIFFAYLGARVGSRKIVPLSLTSR